MGAGDVNVWFEVNCRHRQAAGAVCCKVKKPSRAWGVRITMLSSAIPRGVFFQITGAALI